ncbi:MAG: glycosyltransferase family 39 protein [Candidatus Brocadiaceae bacterium]|nr:glycosyltransferase family 39 protein [Candidatus Brocadiaceae bacterium]
MLIKKIKKNLWWILWFIAGTLILFWNLEDVVGLHRDEAIFGLFAEMILDGARPLYGFFNMYTSPVHSYMLAICIKIFGNSIWSLRLLGPIFTLITIVAIFDVIRQYSPVRARWIAYYLIVFPPVVMLSRLCGEVFVLNPFLFFGAIWIYVRLCRSKKKSIRIIGWMLTGFFLSFGIWNHVIFLPSAISLIIFYALFLWPGIQPFFTNTFFFAQGFLIGLIPRFLSVLFFRNTFFPEKPQFPKSTLKTAFLNLLYAFSGDGLYARFSGGSSISFTWVLLSFFVTALITFYFLQHTRLEKKIFWGICVFLVSNFLLIWIITPFGSIGSRLWLIPSWTLPILLIFWMPDLNDWKWKIAGGTLIAIHFLLLLVNYYLPNSSSNGVILPSVYVGGKTDNAWDYYDHRQMVNKIAQTEEEYVFIGNLNVFTFYYFMPKEQRHRIKSLWPIFRVSKESPQEKQMLYNRVNYTGQKIRSALFVFYDNDKDYLQVFSEQSLFARTTLAKDISLPGFTIFRLK